MQYLDEIVVDMETCEELQKSDAASPLAGYRLVLIHSNLSFENEID